MPKWQNSKIVLSWIYSRRSSLEAGSASLLSFPQKRSKTQSKTIIIIINRSTTDHHLPHSKDQRHSQQMSYPTNPSSPQIPHLALALATNGQKTLVMEWQSKLCFGLYCLFWLTDSLTDSCLVNFIDLTLACEDNYSKLVELVTVADVDEKDRVGNSLLQIW